MSDNKNDFYQEIKIVQNIITRMAQNSFMIKGWTISLVAITMLIKGDTIHSTTAFLPWLAFWCLDAYYLRQERLFRKLYEWLIKNRSITDDDLFSMEVEDRFGKDVGGYCNILFSKTIIIFYLMILVLTIIISWYSVTNQ